MTFQIRTFQPKASILSFWTPDSWLKSPGIKSLGLKLWVEKSGFVMSCKHFLDIERLNYFPKMIQTVGNFMKKRKIQKPLWLGETSSAWGSGAPGLSDR